MLTLDDLAGETLLVRTAEGREADWVRFLGPGRGLPALAQCRLHHNSCAVYLRAVLDGFGIGPGWDCLLDEHLAAGALRLASAHRCATERGYRASLMPGSRNRDAAAVFQPSLAVAGAEAERRDREAAGAIPAGNG